MFCVHPAYIADIPKLWSHFYFTRYNTARWINICKKEPNFFPWQVEYRPGSRIVGRGNNEILSTPVAQQTIIKDTDLSPWQGNYNNNRVIVDNNMIAQRNRNKDNI